MCGGGENDEAEGYRNEQVALARGNAKARVAQARAYTLGRVSRAEGDAYAVESQRRAEGAITEGRFDRGVVPVTGPDGEIVLARDEHPRPGTTLEALAKLREMGALRKAT